MTSNKAEKFLKDRNIPYEFRHIKDENPTYDELKKWYELSGLDIKRFFNTSGKLYKELNIKDKIESSSIDELLKLLSTDGLLVKRPIVIGEDFVLTGFKAEEWEEKF